MSAFKIEALENEQEAALIRARLNEFNFRLVPNDEHQTFNWIIRQEGEVLAGLLGDTYWGWLYISILWVSEALRGQRLGSQLLAKAESEAFARGCRDAHLETHDFQALEFYQKRGYVIFGQLEDLPVGHIKYYLRKKLLG